MMERHRIVQTLVWLTGILVALLLVSREVSAEGLQPGFFPVHFSEPYLLHRRVDPAYIRGFKVWDTRLATWRAMQLSEVPGERTQLVLLHLWADWCKPCRDEFPAVRQLMLDLDKVYAGRVQVVLVSETSDPALMRTFLEQNQSRLPRAPHYLDTGEAIAAALRVDLPTTLSYPITLILDSRHLVIHAVVGPITSRRLEVQDAVARILANLPTTPVTSPH
jgi:thiol-disulfide isomerase/thioredoxin